MAISIKDPETDRLVRALSEATGESLTTAISIAVRERLERVRGAGGARDLLTDLIAIAERAASLPDADGVGIHYDDDGLPA